MKIPFNVDANTARLIGRENVSKLDGAILELVKNAYDADADSCILYYEESSNNFYLIDNGTGMSSKVIVDNWMTIGYSSKKTDYKLSSGRIQTGAKGIGRFALDRIADHCSMLSKTESESILWNVNWSDFNSGIKITDVGAELEPTKITISDFIDKVKNIELKNLIKEKFDKHGTIFKLSDLRDSWTIDTISDIKKSLATLIPPEIDNIFQLYVFSENSTIDESKIIVNSSDYSYDYKIDFNVSEDGNADIYIKREEFDFGNAFNDVVKSPYFQKADLDYFKGVPIEKHYKFNEILPDIDVNTIGAFRGTLYFAKLSAPNKEEKEKYFYKDIISRRDTRDTFGGIKIYRDNFRVRPYGEVKTTAFDWLLLANRKAKSPAAVSSSGLWRVGAEQMLGAVYISRLNVNLPDQSNREGIVETKEFSYFREFLIFVIQEMEKDRQYVCRNLRQYHEDTHPVEIYQEEINKKSENKKSNSKKGKKQKLVEASKAKAVIENKEEQIKDLEDENRLLRTLATTGIVTNSYIHEIKDVAHKLNLKLLTVQQSVNDGKDKEHLQKKLEEALQLQKKFNSWFTVTIEMVKRDKRRMSFVSIKKLAEDFIDSWQEVLKEKNIIITMEISEVNFKCFPYDIESIISNLITNSINSFEYSGKDNKNIKINITNNDSELKIIYEDNGKGLSDKYKNNPYQILEPFETNKRDTNDNLIGTGMGMWIIDKTAKEYSGSVDLSENINLATGFKTTITLCGVFK